MSDDTKVLLELLHKKQDSQTEKLEDLAISVARQEVQTDNYTKQSDRMAEELREMNKHLSVYNSELRVHIAGVLELKEQNNLIRQQIAQRDVEIREKLEIAERPIIWFETTYKWAKWVGAFATAAGLVYAAIKWVSEIL